MIAAAEALILCSPLHARSASTGHGERSLGPGSALNRRQVSRRSLLLPSSVGLRSRRTHCPLRLKPRLKVTRSRPSPATRLTSPPILSRPTVEVMPLSDISPAIQGFAGYVDKRGLEPRLAMVHVGFASDGGNPPR
ncbi:hypothetical protein HPP92_019655 [Vanilla planifolia]|uniref:Uncharacterized protein n=1 Tax=Vanilla planifolia TaxID=51239 RepID=A0A835UN35_VANPL|nr:hypothetical protein HPP92_019655 [Vanilla planifolia]